MSKHRAYVKGEALVGRIAWTEDGRFNTPWMSFVNITEFRRWCTAMRAAIAERDNLNPRKLRSECHYVDSVWTSDSLLRAVQREINN